MRQVLEDKIPFEVDKQPFTTRWTIGSAFHTGCPPEDVANFHH